LFTMYLDLLAQKDRLLAALTDVSDRAHVSAPAQFVRQPLTPLRQGTDSARELMIELFQGISGDLPEGTHFLEMWVRGRQAEIALMEQTHWIITWMESNHAQIGKEPGIKLEKSPEWLAKHNEWDAYARDLAGDIQDEISEQRARERLTDRIAADLEAWIEAQGGNPDNPSTKQALVDPILDYFVQEVMESAIGPAAAAPGLSPTGPHESPSPTQGDEESPTPTPTPDTGWIAGYVEGIATQWLNAGYGGIDVAFAADSLSQCLINAVDSGLGRDDALGECPLWLFEPEGTPQPTQTPIETPTPTPAGVPVTAKGTFDFGDLGNARVTENTMTLTWNSAGGPITAGDARWREEVDAFCGTEWESFHAQFAGEFNAATMTFTGTYTGELAQLNYHREPDGSCVADPASVPVSRGWSATLSGNTVTSDDPNFLFVLTIQ
jgi:hypothetical protein